MSGQRKRQVKAGHSPAKQGIAPGKMQSQRGCIRWKDDGDIKFHINHDRTATSTTELDY
jgi:hypothetical protein